MFNNIQQACTANNWAAWGTTNQRNEGKVKKERRSDRRMDGSPCEQTKELRKGSYLQSLGWIFQVLSTINKAKKAGRGFVTMHSVSKSTGHRAASTMCRAPSASRRSQRRAFGTKAGVRLGCAQASRGHSGLQSALFSLSPQVANWRWVEWGTLGGWTSAGWEGCRWADESKYSWLSVGKKKRKLKFRSGEIQPKVSVRVLHIKCVSKLECLPFSIA